MAGQYRSEPMADKTTGMTRYNLDPQEIAELKALAKLERRSVANMVSVLLSEALQARRKKS